MRMKIDRLQNWGHFQKNFAKKKPSDAFQGTHLRVETFIAEDFLSQHNSSKQCICLYKCDFCKAVFLRPCKMLVGNLPNPSRFSEFE